MQTKPSLLVDARNFEAVYKEIANGLAKATLVGVDVETEDSQRHDGLNRFSGYDEDGHRSANKKLAIDMRRSRLCGVSLYWDEAPCSFYFNLGHADVENRIDPDVFVETILKAKNPAASWVAHNAPFELTIFKNTLNFDLENVICTLQMAVSAFGPDDYPVSEFQQLHTGDLFGLMRQIGELSANEDPTSGLSPQMEDLIGKVTGKQSDAAHSYNGFIGQITYGYGLKRLVKRFFDHDMSTYAETLGEEAHMGQLTGEQVAAYGADDAFWVLPLYSKLLEHMVHNGGEPLIRAFFEQENPMVHVYSAIQRGGMKVDYAAIQRRRGIERENFAATLRRLKVAVQNLLPFPTEPNPDLLRYEKWYTNGFLKYRHAIQAWAESSDYEDDAFRQCYQVRSPVTAAWCEELGRPESAGPNLSHYMPARVMLYDLLGQKPIVEQGKVQSDGKCRGKLLDRLKDDPIRSEVVKCLTEMAGIDQRCKLYLNPYNMLTDPETHRLYPIVSSMLATRRMGSAIPNAMQLAKRGESTYVRGFFEADYDDHVLLSLDWSAIELVWIAELSEDPEFLKAFGQLPHADLHSGATADLLAVDVPELTETSFQLLKRCSTWEDWQSQTRVQENLTRIKTNLKGEAISEPGKAHKYWRTELGKTANFGYWYSGWLHNTGLAMGWSDDKVKAAVEKYTTRFWKAEQWRLDTIKEGQLNGYVTLPDGHRRNRYEATPNWFVDFTSKFAVPGDQSVFGHIVQKIAGKIQRRAHNQLVNAKIQGSSATLTKRSVLRNAQLFKDKGWGDREARFLMPIHDELLFSVHKDLVPEAVNGIRDVMITHPDLFKHCALDSTPSIGLTFEPWHPVKAPLGQVELYELPGEFVPANRVGQRATDDEIRDVVDRLFRDRQMKMAA